VARIRIFRKFTMFDLNSDDSGESEPDLEPLVVQPLLNPAAEDEAAAETTGAGAVVSAAPSNYTIGEVEHEQHQHVAAAGAALAEPAPSGMKRGRPPADPNAEPHFFCDEPGCGASYITFGGLYQHRRKHHPWLIAEAKQVAVANGKRPRGRPRESERNMDELTHEWECPICEKAYASYGGLYQHKRSHHPELVTARGVSKVSLGYYPTARKAASAYALFANSQAVSALAPPAATLAATATEAMDVEPNSGRGASSSAAHSEEVAVRRSSRKGKQPLDPAIGKRVWSWRQDLQRTMAGEIMDFHVWQDRVREHFVRYEDGVSQWRTEAEWWEDENGPTLPSPQ
jgi:hypothetical protein